VKCPFCQYADTQVIDSRASDEGATIRAFCHIQGAHIAGGCEVGPFARLRPGTVLEAGAKVGEPLDSAPG